MKLPLGYVLAQFADEQRLFEVVRLELQSGQLRIDFGVPGPIEAGTYRLSLIDPDYKLVFQQPEPGIELYSIVANQAVNVTWMITISSSGAQT